jgi:hypothetical protein
MSKTNGNELEVIRLLGKGYSLNDIHQVTGISLGYLNKNFASYIRQKNWKKLGHKSEAYYATEDEMLHDPVYTYNDLSTSEKEIYDKLDKGEN